jgi:MFS family permease
VLGYCTTYWSIVNTIPPSNQNFDRRGAARSRIGRLLTLWGPWIICVPAAIYFGFGFFLRVAPSVMKEELMTDFALSGAAFGNLSAFYYYGYAMLQLPAGVLLDQFGPRRVIPAAAALCATGSLLWGLAPSIELALLGRLMIGAGASFAFIGTMKLCSLWLPPERLAIAAGLTAMMGSVGALVGQAPLALIIDGVGWRNALILSALIGYGLAVSVFASARDSGTNPAAAQATARMPVLHRIGSVLSRPRNWALALVLSSMVVPFLAFAALWGVPFMMEAYGLDKPTAGLTMSAFIFGHGLGAPIMGWFSDLLRRRKLPILVGLVGTLGGICLVVYLPGMPLSIVYVVLFASGITSGATIVSFPLIRELNRPEAAGTAMGFMNFLNMTVSAVFQPFLGWLLDLNWDGRLVAGARVYSVDAYHTALLSMVALGLVGMILLIFVRETGGKLQE